MTSNPKEDLFMKVFAHYEGHGERRLLFHFLLGIRAALSNPEWCLGLLEGNDSVTRRQSGKDLPGDSSKIVSDMIRDFPYFGQSDA